MRRQGRVSRLGLSRPRFRGAVDSGASRGDGHRAAFGPRFSAQPAGEFSRSGPGLVSQGPSAAARYRAHAQGRGRCVRLLPSARRRGTAGERGPGRPAVRLHRRPDRGLPLRRPCGRQARLDPDLPDGGRGQGGQRRGPERRRRLFLQASLPVAFPGDRDPNGQPAGRRRLPAVAGDRPERAPG